MKKKVFKLFLNVLDGQEKWLNEMAHKGYHLTAVKGYTYTFESCDPGEYTYKVQLVTDKTMPQLSEYQSFLEELNIKSFHKSLNVGKMSLYSVRWRPNIKGSAALVTSPGTMNKELLILEKKSDDKPLEIFTDVSDKMNYYKLIRNQLSLSSLFCFILLLTPTEPSVMSVALKVILLIIVLSQWSAVYRYTKLIQLCKCE